MFSLLAVLSRHRINVRYKRVPRAGVPYALFAYAGILHRPPGLQTRGTFFMAHTWRATRAGGRPRRIIRPRCEDRASLSS